MSSNEEIEPPILEIDVPPDETEESRIDTQINQTELEDCNAQGKERRYSNAFRLIIGCLCFLGGIYIMDTVCNIFFSGNKSDVTESVIEIIKTLLFTLSGYLFAREESK